MVSFSSSFVGGGWRSFIDLLLKMCSSLLAGLNSFDGKSMSLYPRKERGQPAMPVSTFVVLLIDDGDDD